MMTDDNNTRDKILLPPPPTAASLLFADVAEKKLYWDRSHYDSPESQMAALASSSTLYIGNLAFSTRVCHLKAVFSTVGAVKEIHMGLDRFQKKPCGFAFVEYERRCDALDAVAYLTGTKLDSRVIRVELDAGFKPGRQYGRGASGGQVRDDRRGDLARGPRSRSTERPGMNPSRWQAPPQRNNDDNINAYGPPSGGTDSTPNSSGMKRKSDDFRDDKAEYEEPNAKNSRFQEGSDDEL